jgi:hypothetical protein
MKRSGVPGYVLQDRQWLAGKFNPTYADKGQGVQVNVGLQVALPQADRVKLPERRDKALIANYSSSVQKLTSGRNGLRVRRTRNRLSRSREDFSPVRLILWGAPMSKNGLPVTVMSSVW